MSTSIPDPVNRSADVAHSKDSALDDREFELLLHGAFALEPLDDLLARFIVHVAGRLGLRAGEIAHLRESWIDWRRKMIEIPAHQPCVKGREGEVCGYCRQLAKQQASNNDGLSFDEALATRWHPKTDAAVRSVPYGHDARIELVLEEFFDEFDAWPLSRQGVNRRLESAADKARKIDADDLHPHCLRATAASRFAAMGVDSLMLAGVMGWSDLSVAERYVKTSPENLARSLADAHRG